MVNYNVFNRDGVYVANILQKAGRADLAAEAIDYFLAHPFNGRRTRKPTTPARSSGSWASTGGSPATERG